jgi:beta-1,4-mannosyl-glycoprotein beta-1,4-N-acetylglucosaminyltransferase
MTYDCFTFFNELDLLEIRLNILDPYVDFFVIGESPETFSGKTKPLYLQDNIERFAKWKEKIIIVANQPFETNDSFERAAYQKDNLRETLLIMDDTDDDDIVYFGDLDEIWKPQEIKDDKVYNLCQLNYSYYLNNRSSEEWVGTIVGKWGTVKTNSFNYWRAHHDNVLDNGGWHLTNQGGEEQILKKLDAYDHQEANIPAVREGIKLRMDNGIDYLGRDKDWKGNPFTFWKDETELPKYLLDNKGKYEAYFS